MVDDDDVRPGSAAELLHDTCGDGIDIDGFPGDGVGRESISLSGVGEANDRSVTHTRIRADYGFDCTDRDIGAVDRHDVIDAAVDVQPTVLPGAHIAGAETPDAAVMAEVRPLSVDTAVASGHLRATDADSTVIGELDADSGQRYPVVDAPAGRLGHAVRRHECDTGIACVRLESARSGRAADEHAGGVPEPCRAGRRLQDGR